MNMKRILSFIIDFVIIAIIYEIPFVILVLVPSIQGKFTSVQAIFIRILISTFVAYLLMVFKDIFKDGSVGKKIMKLTIVDSGTKKPASIGKRILRNVTWFLSWIEIIVYLAAKKRIGDMLAKTDVVEK